MTRSAVDDQLLLRLLFLDSVSLDMFQSIWAYIVYVCYLDWVTTADQCLMYRSDFRENTNFVRSAIRTWALSRSRQACYH